MKERRESDARFLDDIMPIYIDVVTRGAGAADPTDVVHEVIDLRKLELYANFGTWREDGRASYLAQFAEWARGKGGWRTVYACSTLFPLYEFLAPPIPPVNYSGEKVSLA